MFGKKYREGVVREAKKRLDEKHRENDILVVLNELEILEKLRNESSDKSKYADDVWKGIEDYINTERELCDYNKDLKTTKLGK